MALDRIEVLRDGASAQYGCDARDIRKARDGKSVNASVWQGFALDDDSFLTVSADYLDRNYSVGANKPAAADKADGASRCPKT